MEFIQSNKSGSNSETSKQSTLKSTTNSNINAKKSVTSTVLKKPISTSKSNDNQKKMSYLTYNKLVGEADGGKELSKEQFNELLQKYHNSWSNRLYVHFARLDGKRECVRVKPPCMCFCGHHFKSHEWWDDEEKMVKCRAPSCKCKRFRYLHQQGSWTLTCKCKHSALDHNPNGVEGKCSKVGCNCESFATSFSCQCGGNWNEHDTIVDTEEERRELGKQVDTDVVKDRLKHKQVEGCGKCMGCKNRMTCFLQQKH